MNIAKQFINSNFSAPYNTSWWIMMYGNRVKDTIYFKDGSSTFLNEDADWVEL